MFQIQTLARNVVKTYLNQIKNSHNTRKYSYNLQYFDTFAVLIKCLSWSRDEDTRRSSKNRRPKKAPFFLASYYLCLLVNLSFNCYRTTSRKKEDE